MLVIAAASQIALELISLVFIVGGFVGCGFLWYFMVVRGGRAERLQAASQAQRSGLPALEDVERSLRAGWSRDTSDDPDDWSSENPALGQCAVSALVMRAIYGGDIVIATVLDRNGERTPDGHAWNILPSGEPVDLTFEQFRNGERLDTPIVTEPVIDGNPYRAHMLADRVSRDLGITIELDP